MSATLNDIQAKPDFSVKELLDFYGNDVEFIYKDDEHEPFIKVVDGHGCYGILAKDNSNDTIQCHICGEWYENLSGHINIHKITEEEYKESFGFRSNTPLVSKELSNVRRMTAIKYDFADNMNKSRKERPPLSEEVCEKISRGIRKSLKYKKGLEKKRRDNQVLQHKNSRAECPPQLKRRIRVLFNLMEMTGWPYSMALDWTDRTLAGVLGRLYGSSSQFSPVIQNLKSSIDHREPENRAIAALRSFILIEGRMVSPKDLESPKYSWLPTMDFYIEKWGSWRRAKRAAGLHHLYDEELPSGVDPRETFLQLVDKREDA